MKKVVENSKVLRVNRTIPQKALIDKAVRVLKRGGVIIFPTDTVYGIGALAANKESIRRIYRLKSRDRGKPLINLVGYKKDVYKFASFVPIKAKQLIRAFWPGPLTLVLKADRSKAGIQTIGVRMPANGIALSILRKAGPMATTSANISNRSSAKCVDDIEAELEKKVDMIIDGGKSRLGCESTVLDVTGTVFKVLRQGVLKRNKLGLK